MPQEVYADTDPYTTSWDSDLQAVAHRWNTEVHGETFREGSEAIIDLIEGIPYESDVTSDMADPRVGQRTVATRSVDV